MNVQIIDLHNPLWTQILQLLRHDVYQLPEYLHLESKRINAIPEACLIFEEEKIFFFPYLLRQLKDLFQENLTTEAFDIVSPYGYSGILLSEAATSTPQFLESAMNQLTTTLRDRRVRSAFIRLHPLLNPCLNNIFSPDVCRLTGETVSIDLRLSDAEIWQQTRPEHRNKINRCKRYGMIARMVSFEQYIDEFIKIYQETMERVNAAQLYYFDYNYFSELSKLGNKLHLCIVELDEQVTCAGLFTECCGIVQYHLGGTKTEFLKQAPSKLMFDWMRFWAKQRGNEVFHLGGGVGSAKDSLYHFKAGFSKQRHNFLTLSLITDKEFYCTLVELRAKSLNIEVQELLKTNFFPAYRSSIPDAKKVN